MIWGVEARHGSGTKWQNRRPPHSPSPKQPTPMRIINLTPHTLNLHGTDASSPLAALVVNVPPSGTIARLTVSRTACGEVVANGGVRLTVSRATFGEIAGLPVPEAGTVFVVSALVAEAAKRADVFSPGELVRDEAGVVTGANGLSAYAAQ